MSAALDVVVVGAGAAGCVAAWAAAKAGARVAVLDAGPSATALSSGAIDVADPGRPHQAAEVRLDEPGPALAQGIENLAAAEPHHPYAVMGAPGRRHLDDALAALRELATDVELVGSRVAGANLVLPTSMGTLKRAALAPRAIAEGDLATLPLRRLGVAHLAAFGHFDGRAVTAMLRFALRGATAQRPALFPVDIPFFLRGRDAHAEPIDLARLLDDPVALHALARAVRTCLRANSQLDGLLMPAALGFQAAAAARTFLQEQVGMPIFEVCMLPPSPPGLRLQQALHRGLTRAGVALLQGRAFGLEAAKRRVRTLFYRLPAGGAAQRLPVGAVVLATGHLTGGGVAVAPSWREAAFGLPLFLDGQLLGNPALQELVGARYEAQQPFLRVGVGCDAMLRPQRAPGERPAFDNLFAAGALLAGNDPARHKVGLGLCALSGFLAGGHAAASAATA